MSHMKSVFGKLLLLQATWESFYIQTSKIKSDLGKRLQNKLQMLIGL